jgi:hypothetical protein
MLRKEHAGFFHSSRTIDGRTETLHKWRVTTGSRSLAQKTARQLGGDVQGVKNSPHDSWEVLTESSAAEIVIRRVVDESISFTLPGEPYIGSFFFSSDMWNSDEISQVSTVGDSYSMRCNLTLKHVEFKTRTGLTVLYILPSIGLLDSGV